MARTQKYWADVIHSAIAGTPELAGLTNTSSVSLYRLFVDCVAFCALVLDVLFDDHKTEVSDIIQKLKPHRESWYREKALAFQYGFALEPDSDVYDNTGVSEDDIETSKVVKYTAVNQAQEESRLVFKIAGETGGVLAPIPTPQFDAFKAYMGRVKDAGVFITFINTLPDKLYPTIDIYYDPLILDQDGNNILLGGKPVEEALTQYMKELPFNGELILASMTDRLQQVPGVVIPHLRVVTYSTIDPDTDDYGPEQVIQVRKKPGAGYFQIVDFLNVTYIANV